jgi:hypothetical protein
VNEHILIKAIDLENLVKTNPELFDFSKLNIEQKASLLSSNTKLYMGKIPLDKLSLKDKAYLVLNVGSKTFQKTVVLTDEEVQQLLPIQYFEFLKVDFKRYISLKKYEDLNKWQQSEIFTSQPEWVVENVKKIPKLTSEKLWELAHKKPAFIDKHISDYSGFSLYAGFWECMIKYNKKYEEIFLRNTHSCATKTDVREVCRKYPEIIKKLDKDILSNSKLTCKEWVLLCNAIMNKNEKKFETWDFSDDLIGIFKLDLMAEMLTGKSKISKRFQSAMKNVFDKEKEENEAEAVVGSTPGEIQQV